MPSLLVISFSRIESDARVLRQVLALQEFYEVTVLAYGPKPPQIHRQVSTTRKSLRGLKRAWWAGMLLLSAYERYYWSRPHICEALAAFPTRTFDLVLVNDIEALPLAVRLANGAPVVLDAHEFAPREYEEKLAWRLTLGRLQRYFCKAYLPKVSKMMTVGSRIAAQYHADFGVRPAVVYNAPAHCDLQPSLMDPSKIRLVHHGIAAPERHLENMFEMMSLLDSRFCLDLLLVAGNADYYERLKAMASNTTRVRLLPPVSQQQLIPCLNGYDLGVFQLPPVNFNYANALPNKFFDFVQARLGVAIGPTPEMAELTQRHNLGVVAEDFNPRTLARALNSLTAADVERFKQNAHLAATELCFEKSKGVLLATVEEAMRAGHVRRDSP